MLGTPCMCGCDLIPFKLYFKEDVDSGKLEDLKKIQAADTWVTQVMKKDLGNGGIIHVCF